jgi:multidrug efflux pump subunit AcrA (membrane-fusion protein)
LFGGFALVFLLLFRDRLIPARSVTVVPAVAIEEHSGSDPQPRKPAAPAADARMLFQASGWIEPDPLPIKATALTDGVVEQVHVLEGDLVKKGDPLASLIAIDNQLDRDAAASELSILTSTLEAQALEAEIAQRKLEGEQAALLADQADVLEAKDRLDRVQRIRDTALPESERVAARIDHDRKLAAVTGRQARIRELEHEIVRVSHQTKALRASRRAAEIKLEQAELAHQRTRITSPVDGRVLRLLTAPGQKKMVGMDDPDSSTIAILYQPDSLQVRVDVPLADASGLHVGQRARIRCGLLPDQEFDGEVTRIGGEADIQRNSLQAKVRIIDPSDRLRPEMLCRVEFLESAAPAKTTMNVVSSAGSLRVHVPLAALRDGSLWVCDPDTRRVSLREVHAFGESRDDFQALQSGVRPGEWVVLDPGNLKPGQRVNPQLRQDPRS